MNNGRTREWKLARRTLPLGGRTLIMGILNVTPDSFSDGGEFFDLERAVAHAEEMLSEGADIIDVGGESTRPGGALVSTEEELRRIVPVVERLSAQVPLAIISVDTTKSEVARAALDAGAEIINDISALRFDPTLADEAAHRGAGLVLMHSRGTPETLHTLPPVAAILPEVTESLRRSIAQAEQRGVARASIAIDPGIGFGKSQAQNLELLARLKELAAEFADFPLLVGTSRKSFIGRLLDDAPVERRLHGTMASVTAAILGGAHIVRVHDTRAAAETARIAQAIRAVTSDE
ncbi:MAG TPA: dihydropteroate synthase [Pyrinomonadaceae bacterium]|jgi:dihydropteroate synthase|nr:dihydropteroate synthase [Pyrinomonadaceae bacterium]